MKRKALTLLYLFFNRYNERTFIMNHTYVNALYALSTEKKKSFDGLRRDSQGPVRKKYILYLPLCTGVYRSGRSNAFRHRIGTHRPSTSSTRPCDGNYIRYFRFEHRVDDGETSTLFRAKISRKLSL